MQNTRVDQLRSEIVSLLSDGRGRAARVASLDSLVREVGLGKVVRAYLRATYGVDQLDQLEDGDLARALQFILRLEAVAR